MAKKESTSRFVSVVNEDVLHNLVGQRTCVNVLGSGQCKPCNVSVLKSPKMCDTVTREPFDEM